MVLKNSVNLNFLESYRQKLNIREAITYVAEAWEEVETSTIVNCWVKTGILSALSGDEIESATLALQDLAYFEKDETDELIIDLTTNSFDPTIEREINNFNNLNNSQILTEDVLDEMQIVHIVLDEQREYEEGDASDTDDELPEVPVMEGLNGLKKFVGFFEQQKSDDFNVEDLKVFRKYVLLMGRKYSESMKQKSISDFFLPV
ncbi:9702_t:CDS:1 [Cetraspora pellucida]|uniref:9702_t:CDS:1 n=1 Tax=Cetraspora pellucida TaxID=1433469 RepID=A0ACA9PMA4_9GLOM|nr:9702_t:CDS:1 [Cetraspora pellucida]